jgi:hypothetical protein
MNQRRELRFAADQSVLLTILGETDRQVYVTVKNVSGRGLGLEIPHPLAAGTAVKVALEDAFVLGEVIYCRDEGTTCYAGVELEHALYSLAELASALEAFSELELGPQGPDTAKYARHEDQ